MVDILYKDDIGTLDCSLRHALHVANTQPYYT